MESPFDDFAFLARSPARLPILRAIAEQSPTRQEIEELTEFSRLTVSRALAQFEARRMVNERDQRYLISPVGRSVLRTCEELETIANTTARLDPLLTWYPPEEFDLDIRWLAEATVTLPSETDPLVPLRTLHDRLDRTTEASCLTRAIDPTTLAVCLGRSAEHAMTGAMITERRNYDFLLSLDEIREWIDRLPELEVEIYLSEDPIPHHLWQLDGTVLLFAFDDHGLPQGVVETTAEPVIGWASAAMDRYLETARPMIEIIE